MPIFLGLDCGGSSCRAVATDERGAVLHQGQAGPANLASTPPGKIYNHILKASGEGVRPNFVCGCFAGLLTQDDRERAEDNLRRIFSGATVRAEPDFFAVLTACEDSDLCVIAGTGSIVCSRKDGELQKSGGRGYLLGDVGSAFQYGKAAMLHFLNEGKENVSEALRAAIQERFGSLEENEVLAKLYRGGTPAAMLSKLVSAFAKDCREGRPYAMETLESQTEALSQVVMHHAKRHFSGTPDLSVTLAGGLWEASPIFRNHMESKLRSSMPERALTVMRIAKAPVYGAVQLARELAS